MRKISKFQFVVPNTRWFGKRSWTWDVPGVTILAPLLRKQGYDLDILEANLENLTPDQVQHKKALLLDERRWFSPGSEELFGDYVTLQRGNIHTITFWLTDFEGREIETEYDACELAEC